jgi:hypothetical protein
MKISKKNFKAALMDATTFNFHLSESERAELSPLEKREVAIGRISKKYLPKKKK